MDSRDHPKRNSDCRCGGGPGRRAVQNVVLRVKGYGSCQRLARHSGPQLASLESIYGPGCRSTSF